MCKWFDSFSNFFQGTCQPRLGDPLQPPRTRLAQLSALRALGLEGAPSGREPGLRSTRPSPDSV